MAAGKEKFCTELITMVRVIWMELRKFRVEADTACVSDNLSEVVGKYLWGNLQVHRVMDDFLQTQFLQHPEVAPQITIYLFEHRCPRV